VVELLATIRVAPRERADERHVLLDQLLAGSEVAFLVVPPQEHAIVDVGHTFSFATAFVIFRESPPSPGTSSALSTTASRIRRSPTSSPPSAASSARTPSPIGPTSISISSSLTRRVTVTGLARTR